MGIPKQIADQAEAVRQYYEEPVAEPEAPGQVVVTDPVEPPVDEPEPVIEEPKPVEDWEKRFKSYKASTDKTIHELRTLGVEKQEALAYRDYELESLRKRVQELEHATPRRVVPEGVLSEEDIESLGPENVERIAKLAEAKVAEVTQQTQAALAELRRKELQREQTAQTQEAYKRSTDFWSGVRDVITDADTIDKDPAFADFLNATERYSGKTWRQLGEAAKAAHDIGRMADIYKRFKEDRAPMTRDGQVVPRAASSGSAVVEPQKKTWTREEYKAKVTELMRGSQTTEKRDKLAALHREFVAAIGEGRIR